MFRRLKANDTGIYYLNPIRTVKNIPATSVIQNYKLEFFTLTVVIGYLLIFHKLQLFHRGLL